jgi:hypothetical protein
MLKENAGSGNPPSLIFFTKSLSVFLLSLLLFKKIYVSLQKR